VPSKEWYQPDEALIGETTEQVEVSFEFGANAPREQAE
jgi:hypothetical protein